MAKSAALISLAASYAERFGRASRSALGELARRYAAATPAASSGAAAAAPIVAHLLGRIAALKRDVLAAHRPAGCAAADAPSVSGDRPLSDSIRQSARKDMLAMSEQDLCSHLEALERLLSEASNAVAGAVLPERLALKAEAERRQLINEVEAALHIGWRLQEDFAEASAHADSESMLLARMSPYERDQYEVRKENARRRQEYRRKKPEVFSLDAARRQAAGRNARRGT